MLVALSRIPWMIECSTRKCDPLWSRPSSPPSLKMQLRIVWFERAPSTCIRSPSRFCDSGAWPIDVNHESRTFRVCPLPKNSPPMPARVTSVLRTR